MRRLMLAAIVLLTACDRVLGIEEYPYAALDSGADAAVVHASPLCEACVNATCAAERSACEGESSCRAAYACLAACPLNDVACRGRCEDGGAGGPALGRLEDCRRQRCLADCHGRKLGALLGPGCDCLDQQCSSEIAACITSGIDRPGERVGTCERRVACMERRQMNPDAALRCFYENRAGEAELEALRKCLQSASCSACDVVAGHRMQCVDQFRWQITAATTVALTISIKDYARETSLAGARVRALKAEQCLTGAIHLDEGLSDEKGAATLERLPVAGGFTGCFEVTHSAYVPALVYVGHPITRAEDRVNGALATPSDVATVAALAGGSTVDDKRGLLLVAAHDCIFSPAAGVTVDIDRPYGKRFYVYDKLPDVNAMLTSGDGRVGFVNVEPGEVRVTMRRGSTVLGEERVMVRAGTMTALIMLPAENSR